MVTTATAQLLKASYLGNIQDCQEKHQQPQIADETTLIAKSKEELKNLLMKVKEENEKLLGWTWHPVPSLCGR